MTDRGVRVLVEAVTRHWRRILVAGVVNIAVGLAAVLWPDVTVLALAVLLGVLLLASGVMLLSIAVAVRSPLVAVLGVLALVAATVCLAHPGAGVFAILFGCALWFFVNGVAEFGVAMSGAPGRLWWRVLGVLSIVAAAIMISSPGVAIVTVGLIAGISFLVHGMGEVALAWHLRTLHRAVTGA